MIAHHCSFVGLYFLGCLYSVFGSYKGYDLVFQAWNSDTSHALLINQQGERIERVASKEFTACLFVFLEKQKHQDFTDIFSFSSKENKEINEIVLKINHDEELTNLYIHGTRLTFEAIPLINKWSHVCISWASQSGQANLYINGRKTRHFGTVQKGHTLGGNGYFVIGHDQDYYCGLDADDGFRGRITQFHLWDRVITDAEVKVAHNCTLNGNVVGWGKSNWRLYGKITKEPSNSPCDSKQEGLKLKIFQFKWVSNNKVHHYKCGCNKEIDALKNFVVNNNLELQSEIKKNQNEITALQLKNTELEKIANSLKETIAIAEKEINTLKQNSTPIGFIYIQLPGQEQPDVIWPNVQWKDVSSLYSGMFFRVVGGTSAPFGQVQEGTSPRLDQVSVSSDQGTEDAMTIPTNGSWSSFIATGASYVATGAFRGIRFRLLPQEVLPLNQAIKVWQRVE